MEIKIDPHTLQRAGERGASETEIREVVLTGIDIPAKQGRLAKARVYDFSRERNGKYYEQKRVEVVYLRQGDEIVTVTVYVFYGKWQE